MNLVLFSKILFALALSSAVLLFVAFSLKRNDFDSKSATLASFSMKGDTMSQAEERILLQKKPSTKIDSRRSEEISQELEELSFSDRELASLLVSQAIVSPTKDVVRADMEDILRFQLWIYRCQNPSDCSQKRQHHFRGWSAGLGAQLQVIGNSFLRALLNQHVFILDYHKSKYIDPRRCSDQSYKCLFLPITTCKATDFALPIGAKPQELAATTCTMFDPKLFSKNAGLSRVYSVEWYFREALRYLTRPNRELKQFGQSVRFEMGLDDLAGKKGVGVKIRAGKDKDTEVKRISSRKCVDIQAADGIDWENVVNDFCESEGGANCDYVFLSTDTNNEVMTEKLHKALTIDVITMKSTYFVEQNLSQTAAAATIEFDMSKRHKNVSQTPIFDEAMSLLVMMQIMAETRAVIGSFASTMTRRIYDFLGMIEEDPRSRFKETDGLSYFTCWREEGEWGLHKKDREGKLAFDCIDRRRDGVDNPVESKWPDHTQLTINPVESCNKTKNLPSEMICGSVEWLYCPYSKLAYLPTPKAASSTIRAILERSFKKFGRSCAYMPSGTLHIIPRDAYVFTAVRNPISRIIGAYRETDSHLLGHQYSDALVANFIKINRNDEPRRFRTFLEDLFAGRAGLNDKYNGFPAHAYPQYLVQCGAPHVNFTLRLESFTSDWYKMLEDMGLELALPLQSAKINQINYAESLRSRHQFEKDLGSNASEILAEFGMAHERLPMTMKDDDYELICKYFVDDFSRFGYACEYNATDLAMKAAARLKAIGGSRLLILDEDTKEQSTAEKDERKLNDLKKIGQKVDQKAEQKKIYELRNREKVESGKRNAEKVNERRNGIDKQKRHAEASVAERRVKAKSPKATKALDSAAISDPNTTTKSSKSSLI